MENEVKLPWRAVRIEGMLEIWDAEDRCLYNEDYDANQQIDLTTEDMAHIADMIAAWNSRAVPSVDMAEVERLVEELTQVAFMVSKLAIPLKDGDNHALPKSVIDKARAALSAVKTKGGSDA